MKTLTVILSAILAAFLVYLTLKYINFNSFINGWLSATSYFAVIFTFKKHL